MTSTQILITQALLLELSIKHNCHVDHIMMGIEGDYLHVLKYDSFDKQFTQLESILITL